MPPRLRDLLPVLREYGITVEKPRTGSHWRAMRDGKVYPIPAHKGKHSEVKPEYLRGLARCYDLSLDALLAKLGQNN